MIPFAKLLLLHSTMNYYNYSKPIL